MDRKHNLTHTVELYRICCQQLLTFWKLHWYLLFPCYFVCIFLPICDFFGNTFLSSILKYFFSHFFLVSDFFWNYFSVMHIKIFFLTSLSRFWLGASPQLFFSGGTTHYTLSGTIFNFFCLNHVVPAIISLLIFFLASLSHSKTLLWGNWLKAHFFLTPLSHSCSSDAISDTFFLTPCLFLTYFTPWGRG